VVDISGTVPEDTDEAAWLAHVEAFAHGLHDDYYEAS
jgi:hypothetical protein